MDEKKFDKLVQQYRDRQKPEAKPKEREKNDPDFVPRGNRIPVIERGSIEPNRDTVYRVGEYAPRGFYSQSQLNNNMSGTDANAIYQATHDQRMRGSWNDPDRDLYYKANDMLTEQMGRPLIYKYGNELRLTPMDSSNEFDQYLNNNPFSPEDYMPEAEYNDLFFRYDTPGGQAINEAYRMIGQKPDTARQEWTPENKYDAYVTGADSTQLPNTAERLYEGVGSFYGIPEKLLANDARQNVYSELFQKWLEENNVNLPWM